MRTLRRYQLGFCVSLSVAAAGVVYARQAPASQLLPWAGWARCQVNVQGPGYSDQQTHTWIVTGGSPRVEGAFRIFPATWNVVGAGSLQKTTATS
ncbi:MAG TPA: hypothetical protein VGQ69_02430, partial [Gemmatimonadales bacterium]|nr:hypothetical protein [Gemmatimonadales bacterium]